MRGWHDDWYLFFFNDTATTEIYTLSLHDALPIFGPSRTRGCGIRDDACEARRQEGGSRGVHLTKDYYRRTLRRSEEHTSELQSRQYLVCRLLLEKKNMALQRQSALQQHLAGPAVG